MRKSFDYEAMCVTVDIFGGFLALVMPFWFSLKICDYIFGRYPIGWFILVYIIFLFVFVLLLEAIKSAIVKHEIKGMRN